METKAFEIVIMHDQFLKFSYSKYLRGPFGCLDCCIATLTIRSLRSSDGDNGREECKPNIDARERVRIQTTFCFSLRDSHCMKMFPLMLGFTCSALLSSMELPCWLLCVKSWAPGMHPLVTTLYKNTKHSTQYSSRNQSHKVINWFSQKSMWWNPQGLTICCGSFPDKDI